MKSLNNLKLHNNTQLFTQNLLRKHSTEHKNLKIKTFKNKFIHKTVPIPINFEHFFSNFIYEPFHGLQAEENPKVNLFIYRSFTQYNQLEPNIRSIIPKDMMNPIDDILVSSKLIINKTSKTQQFEIPTHTDEGFYRRGLFRCLYQLPEKNLPNDEILFLKGLKQSHSKENIYLGLTKNNKPDVLINLNNTGIWFNPTIPHNVSGKIGPKQVAVSITLSLIGLPKILK